jgi:hypothetical protein
MEQFPVKRGELDTLPYQSRPNPYNRSCPVRSYKIEAVRQTACLKHAMLAGLHKNKLSKADLVSRGEGLWEAVYVISPYRNTFLSTTKRTLSNYLAVSLSATRSATRGALKEVSKLMAMLFMPMSPRHLQILRMKL